jgi:hypothetical protein
VRGAQQERSERPKFDARLPRGLRAEIAVVVVARGALAARAACACVRTRRPPLRDRGAELRVERTRGPVPERDPLQAARLVLPPPPPCRACRRPVASAGRARSR